MTPNLVTPLGSSAIPDIVLKSKVLYFIIVIIPFISVLTVFCWSCMIDLSIGLEIDGFISNFMGFYFAEGEPYLQTAHGAVICYWDGIVHFVLGMVIITQYTQRW